MVAVFVARYIVLIQKCFIVTEMANGAAYSELSRQVVLLYGWLLRQSFSACMFCRCP